MTWLTKPPIARILKGVAVAWLIATLPAIAAVAQNGSWGEMAMVSATMGISDSRICIGEGSRGDLGCPSYAPTISPTGRINASAGLTVDSVSLTTVGTTWGYLGSGASYLPNLTSNAVSATNISVSTINGVSVSALGGGGAAPGTLKVFTGSGTYTKPAGLVAAKITVIGGGGAGGGGSAASSGAGGGGGGGAAQSLLDSSSITETVTITVGAGGVPSTGNAGGSGGTSSFGSLVVATGGSGGVAAGSSSAAEGGTGTSGQLQLSGAKGGLARVNFNFGGAAALVGVSTPATWASMSGLAGVANTGSGGGGGTGNTTAYTGGAGGSGIVIVEEYFAGGGSSGGTSSTVVATNPAGSTGQIQYNNGGSFAASAGLLWDNTASLLTAVNISATALTVNGVAITGGAGAAVDRITSGTTSAVATPSGTIDVSGSLRVSGTIQLMSATTAPVCTAATVGTIARINGQTFECRM